MDASGVENSIGQLFETNGWGVNRAVREVDLAVSKGNLAYAVEIKVARESRRPLLESLLADAVLRAQAGARRQRLPTRAIAVVAVPVLTETMANAMRDYIRSFSPETAFGLFDDRGRREFHGEGLESLVAAPAPRSRGPRPSASHAADPFSDLNQLMLKVLLGRYLPEDLLHVKRGRIDGAARLSMLAGTSLPSAWRFLSLLRNEGFLEESDTGPELVRRNELLGTWLSAVRRPSREIKATLNMPVRDPIKLLEPRVIAYRSTGRRIAWGGFAATARLGFQFVHGAPLHLYVEDLREATLADLNLVPAEMNQPSLVVLRKPRWPESLFRAAVDKNGQPTADILQCWLDVSQHPARGPEQADVLWTRVLAPAIGLGHPRIARR